MSLDKITPCERIFVLLSIIVAPLGLAPCLAFTPVFRHAFSNRYLPQSFVYSICEDHRGFLWMGTLEGLAEWDGHEMKVYRHIMNDSRSLPSNDVTRIFEDNQNWLWVGTSRGWARINPQRDLVIRIECEGNVFKGTHGTVWCLSSDRLGEFDYQSNSFVYSEPILHQLPFRELWISENGTLWAYGKDRNLYEKDGKNWVKRTRTPVDVGFIKSSFRLDKETYLLETSQGLVELSRRTSRLEELSVGLEKLDREKILALSRTSQEGVFITTSRHIYYYDPADGECSTLKFPIPAGIAAQDVFFCTSVDKQGIVWVGSIEGVFEYDPSQIGFSNIALAPGENGSASCLVLSIAKDTSGDLWVGTYGRGLYERNKRTDRWKNYQYLQGNYGHTLTSDVVWSVGVDRAGRIWAGTDDGLDVLRNWKEGVFKHFFFGGQGRSPNVNTVTVLKNDEKGNLWCGTYSGFLFNIDSDFAPHSRNRFNLPSQIRSVCFGGDSLIWVGTAGGVFKCDRRTGKIQQLGDFNQRTQLRKVTIWSITSYTDHTLALGTSEGLVLLSLNNGLMNFYGGNDGFPSSNVFSTLADGAGRLWCSTNRGLVRFSRKKSGRPRVLVYDWTDGIENLEFNRGAYFESPRGFLYFGGDKGITVVDPRQVHRILEKPRTIITAVLVTYPNAVDTYRFPGDTLKLSYSDLTLRFRFVAPSWHNTKRVTYYCRLVGVDRKWMDLGSEGRVQYSLLRPGTYVFRARAVSPQGVMDSTGATLCLIIATPFWDNAWLRIIGAAIILGILVFLVRSMATRSQRKKIEILKVRNEVMEQERGRLSRDIHDEIGAGLTEIAILSEVAQRASADRNAKDSFRRVATTARDLTARLGEIIWAIDPRRDRLVQFVDYLRDRTYQYLDGLNLKVKWTIPDTLPDFALSSNVRRNLILICKECVNNAVKHSEASEIEISLKITNAILNLSMSDNGRGLPGGPKRGNGLRNIEERAKELGGELIVESQTQKGVSVTLKLPLRKLGRERTDK